MATTTASKKTIAADEVTAAILASLDAGVAPWRSPYTAYAGLPMRINADKPYRGINIMILMAAGGSAGYSSPYWGSYKEIAKRGGQVRKGEKSTKVIFFSRYTKEVENAAGETETVQGGGFWRVYSVFNAEQADGLDERFYATSAASEPTNAPVEAAESIVSGYAGRPAIGHTDQHMAYYIPSHDRVNVPRRENMVEGTYYPVLFHELTHSTGHANRLNREGVTIPQHTRGEVYSYEELIAELGAAMLSAHASIPMDLPNSASYIAGWATKIRGERTDYILKAASAAQKAVDHILGFTWE